MRQSEKRNTNKRKGGDKAYARWKRGKKEKKRRDGQGWEPDTRHTTKQRKTMTSSTAAVRFLLLNGAAY